MNLEIDTKKLVHIKEKLYFIIALLISLVGYAYIFTELAGFTFFFFFSGLTSIFYALYLAHIRINGVRISEEQFPQIFNKTKELCSLMAISKLPEIYVLESGGVLNAFATRFFGKNMVILYSDFFDLIDSSEHELTFVLAHELAHIKRKHINKQLLIWPALLIPFFGKAYYRACEYTCDRMAAFYTNNPEAAMNGLTILAIGKRLFTKVNRNEYLKQSSKEKGLFPLLAEKLSTHPTLPKRINEVQIFFDNSLESAFKRKRIAIVPTILLSILISLILGVGFYYADEIQQTASYYAEELTQAASNFLSLNTPKEFVTLIESIADGDIAEVKNQLDSGINPNMQDYEGWSPLMWAVQVENLDIVNLFLDYGADPNLLDIYEDTALTIAINNNNIELIYILIESGADPNFADSFGWTPLKSAVNSGNTESVKTLLSAGADPNIANLYGWTPLMSAANNGNLEMSKILLESGANPLSRDEDHYTAFLYAKKSGHNDVAKLIKEFE